MRKSTATKLSKPDGHKARSAATTEQVLNAAQHVFVSDGFERAEIEKIAEVAGRTKGAIYAHFKNKDDLFLALFEKRTLECISQLQSRLKSASNKKQSIETFKNFILELTAEKTFPLLTLEFKLYALRHPEFRDRWIRTHKMIKLTTGDSYRTKLFGTLTLAKQKEVDTNLAVIGPILSTLLLESHFEPELLSSKRLTKVLNELLTKLLRS